MKYSIALFILVLLCLHISSETLAQAPAAQQLITYTPPNALLYSAHNDDFTVKVREPGGDWQDLFEYSVQVDLDKVQEASMVYFDFAGKVEVSITRNNGDINRVQVRPLSYGIKPEVKGNTITFTLTQPRKLSVEVNGDKLHNLHLFASAPETEKPDPKAANVMYFGPGVHSPKDQPGNSFTIPSNTTVYIDGSAVIRGKLLCNRVENVRIIGRGIVDHPQRGIEVTHSKNVEIDGIIVRNPDHYTVYGGESQGLTIRNLKSFSAKGWSDGIDLMSCSDVLIDDVFLRTSDDCIAIYGHRWNFFGSARNIKVQNSILWADIAHLTTLGLHGNTTSPIFAGDTVENITFTNIDILEHDEDDRNYQGCLTINSSDNNLVRNVRYENIRIENFQEGQLLNLRVVYNEKYSGAPGRSIQNVYFKDISYNGSGENLSLLHGHDASRFIDGVTFENLRINGKQVLKAEDANIRIGEHVRNVFFKK